MGQMSDYYRDVADDADWERHFAGEREALAERQQEQREEHRRMHAEDQRFLAEFYPDEGSQFFEEREPEEDWQDGQPAPVGLGDRDPWLRASDTEAFLKQIKHWKNGQNELVPLSDIDQRYARNIIRHLEGKAPELLRMVSDYQSYVECMIDQITTDPERLAQRDPVEWMREQKLYRAIAAIAETVKPW